MEASLVSVTDGIFLSSPIWLPLDSEGKKMNSNPDPEAICSGTFTLGVRGAGGRLTLLSFLLCSLGQSPAPPDGAGEAGGLQAREHNRIPKGLLASWACVVGLSDSWPFC